MKKTFHSLITLPVLIVLGSLLLFLSLPYLFDLYLAPRLISDLPFPVKELSISRLTPWRIRGTLTLAETDRPILSIPRFELCYTPSSLFQKKFTGLLLDSASIRLDMLEGHLVIHGLNDLSTPDSPDKQEQNSSSFLQSLAVEKIYLKNCSITLQRVGQKPVISIVDSQFSLDFSQQPRNKINLSAFSSLTGQVTARGDLSFTGEVGLELAGSGYKVHLLLQAPDSAQLVTLFLPKVKNVQLTGGLFLDAQAYFDQSLSGITGYQVTLTAPHFQLRQNNIIFANNSADTPVTLQVTGGTHKAEYALAGVVLVQPERISLDLKGEMEIPERKFSGISHIISERTNSGATLSFNGNNRQSEIRLSYELAGEAFNIKDSFSVSSFKAEGDVAIDGPSIKAELHSLIPEINFKKNETTLLNLSLHLPFQYPFPANGTKGEMNIEEIRYQKSNSGKLHATLLPTPEGITFTTLFTAPFIPGMQLSCDGSAGMAMNAAIHCRLPETHFDSATFPGSIPLPKGLLINGKLAAEGEFHVTDKVPAGNLAISYRDGTLTYNENKLSKINVDVVLPRLPLLQSSPGQLCTIGSLDFGKVKLDNAGINFRIENGQSIFLEKIQTDWCGGKLETGSFTLAGDMNELKTTLYCDRLGFSELLAQFGINQTESKGSLNGRIPLVVNKRGVFFEDGFLFSTPGDSGIVRFNDTSQIRQSIPDMGKSAYLDYSVKALENFQYNWTKLTFNSRQDDLFIAMQLDGKPARPLPFGYKDGQIVPESKGPGIQHPIRLDVNFRLPLRDLFHYGKNIQFFMENM